MQRRLWSIITLGVLIGLFVSGCGGGNAAPQLTMAPASQLPAELRSAPANVQEAYRFAVANQELLSQIPCFCGCVAGGHKSNLGCYIAEDGQPGGVIQYDNHALGCGICVDITRDVMTMVQEGKDVATMRTIINDRYGSFGPSTDQ
jgi:hypothetical protein